MKKIKSIYPDTYSNIISDYLLDHGSWFGLKFSENTLGLDFPIILSDKINRAYDEDLIRLNFEGYKTFKTSNYFFPGKLVQECYNEVLSIRTSVIFVNRNSAAVRFLINNKAHKNLDLHPSFNVLSKFSKHSNEFYTLDLDNAQMSIVLPRAADVINLAPGQTIELNAVVNHRFNDETLADTLEVYNLGEHFRQNEIRWKGYLERFDSYEEQHRIIAAKSIQTLINNWRAPAGKYKYDGLFPSYYYRNFNGLWAWDSWKHAVALKDIDPELAKNQIRVMYESQNEEGMVADVIWFEKNKKDNYRNTKPPLSGWAINEVYKATGDIEFVKELLPKLIEYHSWWYENRDYNDNGLCEYGATDGTKIAAAWESGMDNAVRFDNAKILQSGIHSFSLSQESIDLNAFLYKEKICIAELYESIGNNELALKTTKEANLLKDKINKYFFNDDAGYFFDYDFTTGNQIAIKGSEAFAALWSGVATPKQAKKVIDVLLDETHFNTYCPLPTLDAKSDLFNPDKGYWRGPVWIDQVYMAIKGMQLYGYENEANLLLTKLINNTKGLYDSDSAIWENYHPLTGEGLNAKHFSWSASSLLLLLGDIVPKS